MAQKKSGKASPKATDTAVKPVKEQLSKGELVRHIATQTGVETKAVKAVLAALEGTMLGALHKKGAGLFVLPGLVKITSQAVPAKKKRFGKDVQIYAPYGYDAVMAMATAMAEAKSADPAKYLPFLFKVKYAGNSGLIACDQYGDIKDGALTLFTYKNGKKSRLEVVK